MKTHFWTRSFNVVKTSENWLSCHRRWIRGRWGLGHRRRLLTVEHQNHDEHNRCHPLFLKQGVYNPKTKYQNLTTRLPTPYPYLRPTVTRLEVPDFTKGPITFQTRTRNLLVSVETYASCNLSLTNTGLFLCLRHFWTTFEFENEIRLGPYLGTMLLVFFSF